MTATTSVWSGILKPATTQLQLAVKIAKAEKKESLEHTGFTLMMYFVVLTSLWYQSCISFRHCWCPPVCLSVTVWGSQFKENLVSVSSKNNHCAHNHGGFCVLCGSTTHKLKVEAADGTDTCCLQIAVTATIWKNAFSRGWRGLQSCSIHTFLTVWRCSSTIGKKTTRNSTGTWLTSPQPPPRLSSSGRTVVQVTPSR